MAEAALAIVEQVIAKGDLVQLTAGERVKYYTATCESLGLNPLTKPFDYLLLNGKLVLYPNRTCGDQLREQRTVSIAIIARETIEGVYVVTARATTPDGRTDESTGAVDTQGKRGEALANAMMKAETKAKRRVTLSICGLGWPDESEVDAIPGAQRIVVTPDGEVLDPPKPVAVVPNDEDMAQVLASIAACESTEQLAAISKANRNRKWSRTHAAALRDAHLKREAELKNPDNDGRESAEHVATEGDFRTMTDAIMRSPSLQYLETLWKQAKSRKWTPEQLSALESAYDLRASDLKPASAEGVA